MVVTIADPGNKENETKVGFGGSTFSAAQNPTFGLQPLAPQGKFLLGPPTEEDEFCEELPQQNNNSRLLAWNIVEEPPCGTMKKELLPIEGSWRLIGNQNFEKYLVNLRLQFAVPGFHHPHY